MVAETINQLFKAFGKEPDELSLRAYCSVLKQLKPETLQRTVYEACNGEFQKFPTAPQLLRLARDIESMDVEKQRQNRVKHSEIVSHFVRQAAEAGWNVAQRDELIDICDRAISLKTGQWKMTLAELRKEVVELAEKVKNYRDRCREAEAKNLPMPDERQEQWGWAIPGDDDWDAQKETLMQYIKRVGGSKQNESSERGALSTDWLGSLEDFERRNRETI